MLEIILQSTIKNIKLYSDQGIHYLEKIPEERFRDTSILSTGNSAGILIQHILGNINQYILSIIGNSEKIRKRNDEFTTKQQKSKKETIQEYKKTIEKVIELAEKTTPEQRTETVSVQCFQMTKIGAFISSISHMFGHIGQIVIISANFCGNQKYFDQRYNLSKKNANDIPK